MAPAHPVRASRERPSQYAGQQVPQPPESYSAGRDEATPRHHQHQQLRDTLDSAGTLLRSPPTTTLRPLPVLHYRPGWGPVRFSGGTANRIRQTTTSAVQTDNTGASEIQTPAPRLPSQFWERPMSHAGIGNDQPQLPAPGLTRWPRDDQSSGRWQAQTSLTSPALDLVGGRMTGGQKTTHAPRAFDIFPTPLSPGPDGTSSDWRFQCEMVSSGTTAACDTGRPPLLVSSQKRLAPARA